MMGLAPHLVRIETPDGKSAGFGCLLDGGVIATCAHVVAEAASPPADKSGSKPTGPIAVRFPHFPTPEPLQTEIVAWWPYCDGRKPDDGLADIAFLHLNEARPPETAPAVLSPRNDFTGQEFFALGHIVGPGDVSTKGRVAARLPYRWHELVKTTDQFGDQIEPGFSGGPVWLTALSVVGGIIAAHRTDRGKAAGLMIPGEVLEAAWRKALEALEFPFAADMPPSISLSAADDAPIVPESYVGRFDLIKVVKERLISSVGVIGTDGTRGLGLHGMGGIGKTLLAAAVVRDLSVRRAFPDGIYWLTLGRQPKLLDLQAHLYRRLTGSVLDAAGERDAKSRLGDALAGRRVLIILDDIWDVIALDAFPSLPSMRLMITTRNAEVLAYAKADPITVGPMRGGEDAKLLQWHAGSAWPSEGTANESVAGVLKQAGGVPLALALCGSLARQGGGRWPDIVNRLEAARLKKIGGTLPEYQNYENVFTCLDASVSELKEEKLERYRDLAVFPEDASIPLAALEALWREEEDSLGAAELVNLFVDRALATRTSDGRLALHDLLHDYLRITTTSLPQRHQRLIAGYRSACHGKFAALTDDGYVFTYLPRHLHEAGAADELAGLLTNYSWIEAKLTATRTPTGLWHDLKVFGSVPAHHAIEEALRHSSPALARRPGLLAQQLWGRLSPTDHPIVANLLARARDEAARPILLPRRPSLRERSGALLLSLEGHEAGVTALALTQDGWRAVSASSDCSVKLWNIENGTMIHSFEGHSGTVRAVVITPDSLRAVSASDDFTLKVWDLENLTLSFNLEGHSDEVTAVALTSDGKRAVSASDDRTLRVWDVDSGKLVYRLDGHRESVNAVAVTTGGRHAVSISGDWTVRVWDIEAGELIHSFDDGGFGTGLALTKDGKRAVTASSGLTLRVWDIEGGGLIGHLRGHKDRINALAISGDGTRAVSASEDCTLKVWDIEKNELIQSLVGHRAAVRAVALMTDGKQAISASNDRTLKVWDLASGVATHTLEGHEQAVRSVRLRANGSQAVSASYDGTIKIWDLEGTEPERNIDSHLERIAAVALLDAGGQSLSASNDGTLKLWSTATCSIVRSCTAHHGPVTNIAFDAQKKAVISSSVDGTLRIWNLEADTSNVLRSHNGPVTSAALTQDASRAISGAGDGTVFVWDVISKEPIHKLRLHKGPVVAVTFVADDKYAISASWDRTLKVCDLESGIEIYSLSGHADRVHTMSAAADGRTVVSGSWDRTVRVWDIQSGRLNHTLEGHDGPVVAVVIDADGSRIVSASHDSTLKSWDARAGKLLRTFNHGGRVETLALAAAGRYAVSAAHDRTLMVWDLVHGTLVCDLIGPAALTAIAVDVNVRMIVCGDGRGGVHFLELLE
jgi:WD40 repeat protein